MESGDDVGETGLAHRDRVDVALDDDNLTAVMSGLPRPMVVEQQRPFVEERRLRRVQIFRFRAGIDRPAAERDNPAGVS